MKGAGILAGALSDDADRAHEAEQSDLDRRHQAATTDATLRNQQTIAKMKPKPGSQR
jgi:hypothetical protein